MNAKSTSKAKTQPGTELRAEYRREDLGAGVRGKYLKSVQAGTNLVLLAPDVARVFNSADSVNEALRSLIGVAARSARATVRSKAKPTKKPVSAVKR